MRDKDGPTVPIRQASIEEFQDAVSRNLPVLYRMAYRYVGDPHDAEDAVQDALLSACKHLDHLKRTAKMTTWLTSIVTNSALSQLRRRPRHPRVSTDERVGDQQNRTFFDILADLRPNPEDDCVQFRFAQTRQAVCYGAFAVVAQGDSIARYRVAYHERGSAHHGRGRGNIQIPGFTGTLEAEAIDPDGKN